METPDYKADLVTSLHKQQTPPRKSNLGGVYLFFSFDLVNSTQYKMINQDSWPITITKFYEYLEQAVHKRFTNAKVWKYVGDEVLFYSRVSCRPDIHKSIPKIYDILIESIGVLDRVDVKAKNYLSTKATAWIANVLHIEPHDMSSSPKEYEKLGSRNIVYVQPSDHNTAFIDFLGPDIDAGFRIAKHAIRKRLVIGADLGYMLYKLRSDAEQMEDKLRIVSLEPLKGIWNERLYPIIWYENDWSTIKSSFLYDEHNSKGIVKSLSNELPPNSELKYILKIFKDIGRAEAIDTMLEMIPETQQDFGESEPFEVPSCLQAEIHCVAIVFSEGGAILVARRGEHKRRFPRCWEFGCGQLGQNESIEECLTRSYKADFNIELEFGKRLLPLKVYSIKDESQHRNIPGVIFIARTKDNPQALKHTECSFITDRDISQLENQVVPDFQETFNEAVTLYNVSTDNFA
ncbi:MAG: NUDIX domain-containing protein [Proteobacteria bacterium]|nr:NUDIX domain-containing protein [Pseudomonadota bacterium]